jgi:hypothetical protein
MLLNHDLNTAEWHTTSDKNDLFRDGRHVRWLVSRTFAKAKMMSRMEFLNTKGGQTRFEAILILLV